MSARDAAARQLSRDVQRARSEGVRRRVREREAGDPGNGGGFARPLEYDESGFPIVQRPSTFASRVSRLISGRPD